MPYFKLGSILLIDCLARLNSTLSIRIEELNAEITVLQVENLRLRQSEISLFAQLKREREKSRKVMADTETAVRSWFVLHGRAFFMILSTPNLASQTLQLTKHLAHLRHTFNISLESTPPPSPAFPPATKPPAQTANSCIPGLRISKPPNFPDIKEEEEIFPSSSGDELEGEPGSAKWNSKSKSHRRLSASKLPLPSRVTSLSESMVSHRTSCITDHQTGSSSSSSGTTMTTKRKSSRRQSGLMSIDTEKLVPPRPASPAFGSPIRLEAARAEEAEEIAVLSGNFEVDAEPDHGQPQDDSNQARLLHSVLKKEKRKTRKSKDKDLSPSPPHDTDDDRGAREYTVEPMRSREKQGHKEDDLPLEGTKSKLRDMTRAVLQPIDCNTGELTSCSFSVFAFRISHDRNSGATKFSP